MGGCPAKRGQGAENIVQCLGREKELILPIRAIKFPSDIDALIDLTVETFQYPENEAWSVQADDEESITDTFKSLKTLWPLFRLIGFFSPKIRNILNGFFWEEDGKPVGMIVMQRQNDTSTWMIGNVGVLPEFRRRGIARKLVVACLDFIRSNGGEIALLDVVAENLPAYKLYEEMGFIHYTSRIEINYLANTLLPEIPLAKEYTAAPMKKYEWRPRFELEKEIAPAEVQIYEPVTEAHYNSGKGLIFFSHLLMKLSGQKMQRLAFCSLNEKMVAIGYYRIRKKEGGVNGLNIRVHPDHPAVAAHIVPFLINTAIRLGPDRRIEFSVPAWQNHLLDVVLKAGCEKRFEYHSMGLKL